ncbi:MAG: S8/S53 family peptidase [Bacteroidota bacterium]
MLSRLFIIFSFLLFSVLSFAQLPKFDKLETGLWERLQADDTPIELILLLDNEEIAAPKGSKLERATFVFEQLQKQTTRKQARLKQWLNASNIDYRSLTIVNALLVEGDANLVRTLSQHPDVQRIIYNAPASLPEVAREEIELRGDAVEWGIINMKANQVWQMGYRGDNVVVGGQDTGYEWEHPALIDQYRGNRGDVIDHNYNWHDAIRSINPLNNPENDASLNPCGLNSFFPCDDNNHGTHTMGTAVGEAPDNQIGVAPEARWIGCRNMERGYGTPFTYLECFEWFLAPTNLQNENPRPDLAPHVIINSWSCPEIEGCTPDNFALLQVAVKNLKASGVVVVVSAGNSGNSGCASISTPAAIFQESFTVGAINRNDTIAAFSSRGPVTYGGATYIKPNVAAPGIGVRSAIRGDRYATFSGTSMAGPHVAGAVALMISANPELAGQVEEIERILEQTAIGMMPELICNENGERVNLNNSYGHGRVDALAAVEAALLFSDTEEVIRQDQFELFPNPSTGIFSLQSATTAERLVRILDGKGSVIRSYRWMSDDLLQIDLSAAPSGIYFCQIQAGNEVTYRKMVKR